MRQKVDYPTTEKPGTLVVDTRARFLYLVEGNGRALRYGVGLGRQGYAWSGRGVIRYKQQCPRWTPTDGMADASTDINNIKVRGGMVAGIDNPLGARALYIYKDGKDTLYRVHGTPDWQCGQAGFSQVACACTIRMSSICTTGFATALSLS